MDFSGLDLESTSLPVPEIKKEQTVPYDCQFFWRSGAPYENWTPVFVILHIFIKTGKSGAKSERNFFDHGTNTTWIVGNLL